MKWLKEGESLKELNGLKHNILIIGMYNNVVITIIALTAETLLYAVGLLN